MSGCSQVNMDLPYERIKETLIEAINFGQKLKYYKDKTRVFIDGNDNDKGFITQLLWRKFPEKDSISVEEFDVEAGCKSGVHEHKSHEYIIFYYGEVTIWMNGKVISKAAPDSVHIPPNTPHNIWTNDDRMKGIAVFIPAEENFEIISKE